MIVSFGLHWNRKLTKWYGQLLHVCCTVVFVKRGVSVILESMFLFLFSVFSLLSCAVTIFNYVLRGKDVALILYLVCLGSQYFAKFSCHVCYIGDAEKH